MQGGWNFLPHANLWIDLKIEPKNFKIYLAEPSGNLIPYTYSHKKSDHILVLKPNKGFGQCSGSLSGKTNISKNALEFDLENGIAVLLLPNGGSRTYKGEDFRHWDIHHWRRKDNQRRLKSCYRLVKEVLPSGHKIHYHSYDIKESSHPYCHDEPF